MKSNLPSNRPASEPTDHPLYPLTFDPVFKDYPWGGRNLQTVLGRKIPDGIVAESWDIAAHPDGSTAVNTGPLKGKTLPEVQALLGPALVGERSAQALELGRFPLLIKLLDANRWLSVQVHPDDAYGLEHEGEFGKTEMWVVLHAAPGAELIYGFQAGMTRERYAQEIGTERSADGLHRVAVKPGDVIFVPAGSIHALGPGIIVAEIQQNSNTTYRIYDWGRPRPLHLQQALAVLNFDLIEPEPTRPVVMMEDDGFKVEQLVSCPYFETERVTMPAGYEFFGLCDGDTFEIWAVLAGEIVVHSDAEPVTLTAVQWVLLPAELGEFQIEASSDTVLLRVFVP
ncbi:MAG: mannose-6-phosphate isomerase [Caldilineaceae bacterium]|nr:mannose-6-phosphate isomerase [Caldilineaceae bacterium]